MQIKWPLSGGSKEATDPARTVPELRGLGPSYDELVHGLHADVLIRALTSEQSTAVNIALTGHYGSGKSSIILGVQNHLDDENIPSVNLSMSSLGLRGPRSSTESGSEPATSSSTTNQIQKEIVKQLLYRDPPSDMPGSRYRRSEQFRAWPAALWSALVAAVCYVGLVLAGLVPRVNETFPQTVVEDLPWVGWFAVGGFSAVFGLASYVAMRAHHRRPLRVESFNAAGASITLTGTDNTYFDAYLDEIVYYFEASKTRVVVFEDLDRFEDPHIFETLRELNAVLNNSNQVTQVVRFLHAVRDSVFERLDLDLEGSDQAATHQPSAVKIESQPSSNRTKFFDLIVPTVPFLTTRSAKDLVGSEFDALGIDIPTDLVDIVSNHLVDMRVIRNICNEFEVYRSFVLEGDGVSGLTAERLLAMMVYKNLHLDHFEDIRLGKSPLDDAHRTFRWFVGRVISEQADRRTEAERQLSAELAWKTHCQSFGEKLAANFPILGEHAGAPTRLHVGPNDFDVGDVANPDLWRAIFEDGEDLRITFNRRTTSTYGVDRLEVLLGHPLDALRDEAEADRTALESEAAEAEELRQFVTTASLAELLNADVAAEYRTRGRKQTLRSIVGNECKSELLLALLTAGYIDENYALYCSDLRNISASANALNYFTHCVQPRLTDFHYAFDSTESIEAVSRLAGRRLFESESVFNFQLFLHFLKSSPDRLGPAFSRLAASQPGDEGRKFMNAVFLMQPEDALPGGAAASELQHLLLSRLVRWKDLFIYLEALHSEGAEIDTLLDEALRMACGHPDVEYRSSPQLRRTIPKLAVPHALASLEMEVGAPDLVRLWSALDLPTPSLDRLGPHQKAAFVEAGLYSVTRFNILQATDSERVPPLDEMLGEHPTVFSHVIGDLDKYLESLESERSLSESADLPAVLKELAEGSGATIDDVLREADPACVTDDLSIFADYLWMPIVRSGRCTPTVQNLDLFLAKHKLGPVVGDWLAEGVTHHNPDEPDHDPGLALRLLNHSEFTHELRFRLACDLAGQHDLQVEQLADDLDELLPDLVAAELVEDSPAVFDRVAEKGLDLQRRFLSSAPRLDRYISELPVDRRDLVHIFQSPDVAPEVTESIAGQTEFLVPLLSEELAEAICSHFESAGSALPPSLLVPIARTGVSARVALTALRPHLGNVSVDIVHEVLEALGGDYARITKSGGLRPSLPALPGTKELLEELARVGHVSSFSEEKSLFKSQAKFRVNLKR